MPIKYEYDPNLNIVYCRPCGELSSIEIGDYFKKILDDDEIKIGFIEIVHFKHVENYLLSSNNTEHNIKLYNELKKIKKLRATIAIGGSDKHFEIARMFKILHDFFYPKDYFFIARNEEEADKFIKSTIG